MDEDDVEEEGLDEAAAAVPSTASAPPPVVADQGKSHADSERTVAGMRGTLHAEALDGRGGPGAAPTALNSDSSGPSATVLGPCGSLARPGAAQDGATGGDAILHGANSLRPGPSVACFERSGAGHGAGPAAAAACRRGGEGTTGHPPGHGSPAAGAGSQQRGRAPGKGRGARGRDSTAVRGRRVKKDQGAAKCSSKQAKLQAFWPGAGGEAGE